MRSDFWMYMIQLRSVMGKYRSESKLHWQIKVPCLILIWIPFCLWSCSKKTREYSDYEKPYIQLLHDRKFEEAKPLAAKALSDARRELGGDHLTTIQIAHAYAFLLSETGPFDEAEALLLDIIRLDSIKFGSTSLNLGPPCFNLAKVYRRLEKLGPSIAYFQRTIQIRGNTTPELRAMSYREIAEIKRQVGRPAEALEFIAKTWEAERPLLSRYSPDRTVSMMTAARAYTTTADYARAESLLADVGQIAQYYWKDTASSFVDWFCAKGDLELDRTHYQSALYYYQRSSQMYRQQVNSVGPDMAMIGVGFAEFGLGHFEKAKEVSDSLLRSNISAPITGNIWRGYASVLKGQLLQHDGNLVGADSLFMDAQRYFATIDGERTSYVAGVYHKRSDLARAKGNVRAADSLLIKARDIAELALGIDAPRLSDIVRIKQN